MIKKTPDEWLKDSRFAGITVLDPDGWDRSDFEKSWAEEITEGEMNRRIIMSTCLMVNLPPAPMPNAMLPDTHLKDGLQTLMNGIADPSTKGI